MNKKQRKRITSITSLNTPTPLKQFILKYFLKIIPMLFLKQDGNTELFK
jgi:hypothetical protein